MSRKLQPKKVESHEHVRRFAETSVRKAVIDAYRSVLGVIDAPVPFPKEAVMAMRDDRPIIMAGADLNRCPGVDGLDPDSRYAVDAAGDIQSVEQ